MTNVQSEGIFIICERRKECQGRPNIFSGKGILGKGISKEFLDTHQFPVKLIIDSGSE